MFMIMPGTIVIAGIVGNLYEKTGFTHNGYRQLKRPAFDLKHPISLFAFDQRERQRISDSCLRPGALIIICVGAAFLFYFVRIMFGISFVRPVWMRCCLPSARLIIVPTHWRK